jgi:hypothetical protein
LHSLQIEVAKEDVGILALAADRLIPFGAGSIILEKVVALKGGSFWVIGQVDQRVEE